MHFAYLKAGSCSALYLLYNNLCSFYIILFNYIVQQQHVGNNNIFNISDSNIYTLLGQRGGTTTVSVFRNPSCTPRTRPYAGRYSPQWRREIFFFTANHQNCVNLSHPSARFFFSTPIIIHVDVLPLFFYNTNLHLFSQQRTIHSPPLRLLLLFFISFS